MAVKALDFIIGMTDKITAPLKKVTQGIEKLEKVTDKASARLQKIGVGALAIWGVGKAFNGLIEPAQEMQKALDLAELSGVKNLDSLRLEAKKFAGQYATSATDFVNSTALIKNSIAGITDQALPRITSKVNLLSKATGTSVEESTKFMAKMFDEYKSTAIKMGGYQFADHIASLAAYSKQNFNMTPDSMRSMLEGSNNAGSNYGVSLNEQIATLGMLNQGLGSAGSSSYEQMLQNMESASKKLGISFTDANGKLLEMPLILDKLQAKFGKNIDGNIQAQQMLNDAFGSGSNAVKYLMKNSDKLDDHLTRIGKNKGLSIVQKMAEANVKPWDKISSKIENMKESLGRGLLPVFDPIFNFIDKIVNKLSMWMEMFPNISKWIGIIVSGLMTLGAVTGVIAIISASLSSLLSAYQGLKKITKITGILSKSFLFLSSPIGIVIASIAALVAIGYVLWKNWDDIIGWISKKWDAFTSRFTDNAAFKKLMNMLSGVKNYFGDLFQYVSNNWTKVIDNFKNFLPFQLLTKVIYLLKDNFGSVCEFMGDVWGDFLRVLDSLYIFDILNGIFSKLGDLFFAVIAAMCGDWDKVIQIFKDNVIVQSFMSICNGITNLFKSAVNFIYNIFIDLINGIIDGVNNIPGVNIDLLERDLFNLDEPKDILTGTDLKQVESQQVINEAIKNIKSQSVDNSQNIASVIIQASNGLTPEQLKEWEALASG